MKNENHKHSNVVEYSEHTTFHGLKYVFRPNQTITERIFWIIVLANLFMGLGYFVYTCISRFLLISNIITENTQSTHIFEIPFPAVTICPANKIQHFNLTDGIFEEFSKYLRNNSENEFWHSKFGSKFIMATQICHKSLGSTFVRINKFLQKLYSVNLTYPTEITDEMIRVLDEMAPGLTETMRECQLANWHDREIAEKSHENVNKLFSTILTNDGLCFTFNIVSDVLRSESTKSSLFYDHTIFNRDGWHPDQGYFKHVAYPFKAIVRGNDHSNGLQVLLFANLSGRTDHCLPRDLGYKLLLHSPSAYPNTYEKFITLDYGKEYTIAVRPETISTVSSFRSYHPKIRQCYFNDERPLKYYTFYNLNNCKLECYANYSLSMFGGVPFSAPRDENTSARMLKSHNYGWHLPNYFGSAHEYQKTYKNTINLNESDKWNTDCNCLPECNSIHYDYEIVDVNVERDFGPEVVQSYVKYTTFEIIFEQPIFVGKQRVQEYSFDALVSDFGGLLGLFMGGSFISVFELFYFLVIRKLCGPK